MSRHWLICDSAIRSEKGFCLYTEEGAARLKSDPPRCCKHGAILGWADHATIGTTRAEARKLLTPKKEMRHEA